MRIHSSAVGLISSIALALALAGCGGSSSSSDNSPLTVSAVSPANGATGVAPGSDLRATFSKALDCTTLAAASFAVSDADSNAVQGSVTCTGSEATFAPTFGGLPEGAVINASLTTAVKGSGNDALAAAYNWSFTTGTRAWSAADTVFAGATQIDPPLVRFDGHGNAFAAWREDSLSIRVSRYTPAGGWTTTNVSGDIADMVHDAQLYVAPSGNAVVAWRQGDASGNYQVWTATYAIATGKWGVPTSIDIPDAGNTDYLGLGGDANGNAMAVWDRDYVDPVPGTTIVAAYFNGSKWSKAAPIDDTLTNEAWGNPAVSFVGNKALAVWEQNDGTSDRAYYSRYTPGSGWTPADFVETGGEGPTYLALAADAAGNAVVLWDENGGPNLSVNHYDAGSGTWGATPVHLQKTTNGTSAHELAMDAAGNALVVWSESDGTADRIYSSHYDAATQKWSAAETIDDGSLDGVSTPHVAMDPKGNAVAIWEYNDVTAGVWHIAARRYLAGAWAAGADSVVRLETANESYNEGVAMDSHGNAMAVWRMVNDDGVHDDLRWSVLK